MKFVQIKCTGEMNDCEEKITTRNMKSVFKKLSTCKQIQHLYTWSYDDLTVFCYGNIEGPAGTENKHDLPPNGNIIVKTLDNSDTQLLFNDIFMVVKEGNTIVDFDTGDYSLFYSVCFEGFDDCYTDEEEDEEEEDEEEDDDDEMNDFIVDDIDIMGDGSGDSDKEGEEGEYIEHDNDSDEDLDEDISSY